MKLLTEVLFRSIIFRNVWKSGYINRNFWLTYADASKMSRVLYLVFSNIFKILSLLYSFLH